MSWRIPALVCVLSGLSGQALADAFDLPPDVAGAAPVEAVPSPVLPPAPGTAGAAGGEIAPETPATEIAETEVTVTPDGAAAEAAPFDAPAVAALDEAPADGLDAPSGSQVQNRASTLTLEGRYIYSKSPDGSDISGLRTSAQWMGHKTYSDTLSLRFNLRALVTRIEGQSFSFDESARLDVQELSLNWKATPDLSFDIGRVNLRNGVALGFNPTDWFKANSLVTSDSVDPGDRRLDRLGTLMIAGTASVGPHLLSFGYRPEIHASGDDIFAQKDVFGLQFDRTNPSEAFFLKFAPATGDNISITTSLLVEDGDPGVGFEISGAIGDNLVLYAETFAQKRLSLAEEGMIGGSPALRRSLGADGGKSWMTQLALGGTWALPASMVGQRDMSLSLEYHFNEAGLSSRESRALARAAGPDLAAAGSLRGFAADQQEPLAREQLFARFAWNDFWKDADLAAIGFYVPADDSGLIQVSAAFPLNDNAEISLRAAHSFGDETTIYGANPSRSSVQAAFRYTF